MPDIETDGLVHKATLWEKVGENKAGQTVVSAPVEIDVRWTDRRSMTPGPEGTLVVTDASVVVAIPIPNGSLLWKGKLADWPGAGDLHEVVGTDTTDDIRGMVTRRMVRCQRYRKMVPTVV